MRSDRYIQSDLNNTTRGAGRRKSSGPRRRRTLRFLLLLILLLIAAIAGLIYRSYISAKESLLVDFTSDNPVFEVGDGPHRALEYVNVPAANLEVIPSDEFLDTDTIGDKEIVFTACRPLYGGLLRPTKDFTFNYSVTDSTPPVMLSSGDGAVLERGTEFDINNVIAYGDNSDPEPDVTVDGNVDMNQNGSYPLHVTVSDSAGNSIDWDLTVEVADSVPVYTDDSPRTSFSDFKQTYAADGRSFGIDVSSWQGDVDFDAVKSAGCDFVIIRIGYTDDGVIQFDDKFEQNYRNAGAAGLKVGLYLYSYDNSEEKVRSAASQIIDKLGGDIPDLPIAFDWEDFAAFQTYKMSFIELNRLYDAFAGELKAAGYDSMLYGSKTYLEKIWTGTDSRPVWLAHYTDETDYAMPYMMWQASCTGRIDGIDGDVDMDILF